jgi:hypothetical protein
VDSDPSIPCIDCGVHLRGDSAKGLTDVEKLATLGVSENIRNLSTQICGYYSSDSTKVAENVKKSIINHMKKYEKIKNPTPTQMVKFLNRNKNFMTCGDDNAGYMVESFRHGAYDQLFNVFMFDYLLLDDESLYVDVNAISYTGGKSGTDPETTLDYMYREFISPEIDERTRKEIKRLINMFELDLGAKRYANLPATEKDLLLVNN